MGKAPAGASTVIDRRYSYPLITIVAMLCLSYCLVGLNRAVSGGISVFTSDTMEAWAVDASLRGYYFDTNIGWHIPEWPWVVFMLKSGLPFITLLRDHRAALPRRAALSLGLHPHHVLLPFHEPRLHEHLFSSTTCCSIYCSSIGRGRFPALRAFPPRAKFHLKI